MTRKSIPNIMLIFLYVKTGSKYIYSGCNEPIFEDNGLLTEEYCHIEAFSQG